MAIVEVIEIPRQHAGVVGGPAVLWLLGGGGGPVPPEGRAHVDVAPVGPLPDALLRLVACADPEVASGQACGGGGRLCF